MNTITSKRNETNGHKKTAFTVMRPTKSFTQLSNDMTNIEHIFQIRTV